MILYADSGKGVRSPQQEEARRGNDRRREPFVEKVNLLLWSNERNQSINQSINQVPRSTTSGETEDSSGEAEERDRSGEGSQGVSSHQVVLRKVEWEEEKKRAQQQRAKGS